MATLNIKNLPDRLYSKLKERAKRERRSVAQEVTRILEQAVDAPNVESILDLRGLGKELWEDTSATAHVEGERNGWD